MGGDVGTQERRGMGKVYIERETDYDRYRYTRERSSGKVDVERGEGPKTVVGTQGGEVRKMCTLKELRGLRQM